MGINELLKILRPLIVEKHLSEFSGKTAAVDMMAWIYRGAYASAVEVGQGKKSDLYLNFPMKMLAMLKSYNINCIAVFDGKQLKMKEQVEELRNENKLKNLEIAKKLQAEGKEEESRKIYRRALKIKSKMINTFIEIIKKLGIKLIVAPYEADSQISFLCKSGMADFAITEDSDLIPFGVERIAYKLDSNGNFSFLDMEGFKKINILNITDPHLRSIKKIFSNHLRLVEFCVMLGCDYLPSIKGYGFKTAISMFESYEKLDTVLHQMKFIEKFRKNIPENYHENVKKCVALFFLQTVYNPIENKLQPMTDLNCFENDDKEIVYIKDHLKLMKFGEDVFGDLNVTNFKEFCQGNLDVKSMSIDKKLEDKEVLTKYVNRFKNVFKNNSDNNDKSDNYDEDGITKDELEQIIQFDEINQENLNEDQNEKIIENLNDNNFTTNYYDDSNFNQNNPNMYNNYFGEFNNISNLNSNNNEEKINFKDYLGNNIRNEDELEMQYYIEEINKKEKKKINLNNLNNNNSFNKNDDEITNILKLCESLSKSDKKVNLNLINDDNNNSLLNLEYNSDKNNNNTPDRKNSNLNSYLNSNEKPIKDLFDILEKEKQEEIEINEINKNIDKSPFKTK